MRALPFLAILTGLLLAATHPAAGRTFTVTGTLDANAAASSHPLNIDRPGKFTVAISAELKAGKLAVRLVDANGRALVEQSGTRWKTNETVTLPPGSYRLELAPAQVDRAA